MRDFSDVSNLILSESISIFELVDIRKKVSKKVFNYIISILRIFFNYHRTTRCSHSIRYLLVRYHIY